MEKYLTHPVFQFVSEIINSERKQAYVVGGYVRDLLLERQSKDIDIVVVGSGIELAKKVADYLGKKTKLSVYKNFGTALLKTDEWEIEFVGARKESYRKHSRKPIVEDGTLDDDLRRRDFTVNALAIALHKNKYGKLLDPFNGIKDLKNRIIRTPLEPAVTFSDDPLRMLRAIRFATQLKFRIENNTYEGIKASAGRINIVSKERISDELNKIIMSQKPSYGFILLENSGLLNYFLAQLAKLKGVEAQNGIGHKDIFYHSIEVLDNICEHSENLWLRWAALLHDIAKPMTKKFTKENGWTFYGHEYHGARMLPGIFSSLRLPLNENMKYVEKLIGLHLRPISLAEETVTDSAIRRLLFDAGDDIDDLMLLAEADITSKNELKVETYLNNFKLVRKKLLEVEQRDAIRNFKPPISGEDIMKTFNLPPCKTVGIIKYSIKDAILDGIIANNREEAYELMLKKGKELGYHLGTKNH
ncbi:MAG: HD domain-containing protein [Bacteroidia bacterium]|nr:HD domain-containing protein [Bacteroidia bacterium]